MFTLIVRAIIIYLLVLLVFRLMGKRQIGQMQPFELVLTLIVADLATIPMTENTTPVIDAVVPLITLVVVHYFLTFLSKKSKKFGQIISGKPIIIIDTNGIVFSAIQQLDITVEDIFEAIRGAGYFNLEEVQYAVMETNGTVNVLPKSAYSPATPKDLALKVEPSVIPVTLISEGKYLVNNFDVIGISIEEVERILSKYKIKSLKKVLVLTATSEGDCYLQEQNKPFFTFSVKLKGGKSE